MTRARIWSAVTTPLGFLACCSIAAALGGWLGAQ